MPPSNGSSMTPSASGVVPPAPPGWSVQPVSGNSFTITRTLLAKVTAASNVPCTASASSTLSYSVSIHAQPYNFHQSGAGTDNGDGTLSWDYVWGSTTGDLTNLGSGCTVYEYVSYDGNPAPPGTYFSGPPSGYAPPHPPVGPGTKSDPEGGTYTYVNPTISPSPDVPGGAASAGAMNDIQDKPYSFAPPSSCVEATWTSTQTYKFNDTATGDKSIVVPEPGSGPMTITRRVYSVQSPPPYAPSWYYTVNKSGVTCTPLLITAH